jgi:NADH-quinone oxidoreductase subunit H
VSFVSISANPGFGMAETVDQIFVIGKSWLVALVAGWFPPEWQETVGAVLSAVISVASMLGVFLLLFGITTVLERKGLGRIQNRYGPNRVGPWGFLQFVADGIKALIKEDVVPRAADRQVHFLAPIVLLVCVIATFAVLPVGRNMVPVDLDAGILFFFAAGAATELAVFMAGWASRNKYSLFGAMRAIAQMISYEVPLILSAVPVVMVVGSLSTVRIVEAQAVYSGIWPQWHVFTPWGVAGLVLFLIAATAEMNRSPFDLPEGESELVAGYFTEYSGFKFAMFFIAEYLGMLAMSAAAVTLFLGGWSAPFSFLTWIPSWFWFFAKLMVLVGLFIWVRGTVPRLRMDQLMNFAWKFLLPMALINIGVAGVWHLMMPGIVRWTVTVGAVLLAYLGLSRSFLVRRPRRIYRYAD